MVTINHTRKLSPIVPLRPHVDTRYPPTEPLCEMKYWRIECLQDGEPRNRWVCELLCQGGYRHDIFISGSFKRCLSHARRFERVMHEHGLMPEAPLPLLNLRSGVMTWPDGSSHALPPWSVVPQASSPRGHLRLV